MSERAISIEFFRAYYPEKSEGLSDNDIIRFLSTKESQSYHANEAEFNHYIYNNGLLPKDFQSINYIIANTDLWSIRHDITAKIHYIESGAKESRPYQRPFDPEFYRDLYFFGTQALSNDELRQNWLTSNAQGYGSLQEALVLNDFRSLAWVSNFDGFAYAAHNNLSGTLHNNTQAIVHFISTGHKQLLPARRGMAFDPRFCLEFSGGPEGLSKTELYKLWIQIGKLSEIPANEAQWFQGIGIQLPNVPDGFRWRSSFAGSPRPKDKWSAFAYFADKGIFAVRPLPLADDCAPIVLTAIADRYATRGFLTEAERIYNRALLYASPTRRLLQHAGDLALRCNKPERALQLYEAIAEQRVPTLWTYANAASAALQCGDFDAARRWLFTGIKEHPKSKRLHDRFKEYLNRCYDLLWSNYVVAMRENLSDAGSVVRADLHQLYLSMIDFYRADLHALDLDSPSGTPQRVASRSPKLRVVMLANTDLPQCTHYRIRQKQEQLENTGIDLLVFEHDGIDDFISAASTAEAVIFYRVAASVDTMRCMAYCQVNKIPTFYDIDDLVFDPEHFPEELAAYAGSITEEEHFALRCGAQLVKTAIEFCDFGIASTEKLGRHLSSVVRSSRCFIHRNALSSFLYETGLHIRENPTLRHTEGVLVFYGSATKAHGRDFHEQVEPAIEKLMIENSSVKFLAIGSVDVTRLANRMPERVEHIGFIDGREAYLSLLAKADINLLILGQNEFNNCKSEIKWLEAAALQIPSIVSDVAGVQETLTKGKNVVVCGPTSDRWLAALRELTRSAARRQRIGMRAQSLALKAYRPDICGMRFETEFKRLLRTVGLGSCKGAARNRLSRVLVVNVFFPPQAIGGATRVVADQIRLMKQRYNEEFEVAVFCTNSEEVAPYKLECNSWMGTTVYAAGVPHREYMDWDLYDPQVGVIFGQVLDSFMPDLIHFHCVQRLTCAVVEQAAERGIPFFVTVHDAWWISDHQFLMDEANQLRMPWEPEIFESRANPHHHVDASARRHRLASALDKACAVLVVSASLGDIYKRAGTENVKVVQNGIPELPALIRSEGTAGKVRLGHIGGTAYHKGFFLLQDTIWRGSFPDLELLIVDSTMETGEERFERWGDTGVRIIGMVPQERAGWLYGQFDVLVAPSLWPESFGLVVREALAYGLWVIASNRGAMSEAITDGQNGFVIDVMKPDALAELLALMQGDTERYRRPPALKFQARTVADQVAELCSLYREALASRSRVSSIRALPPVHPRSVPAFK